MTSKIPKLPLPTPTNVVPQAGQNWGNYWTAIVAMGFVAFIIYIAANGQATTWINLFKSQSSSGSAGGATTSANTGATTGGINLGPFGSINPSWKNPFTGQTSYLFAQPSTASNTTSAATSPTTATTTSPTTTGASD